MTKQILTLHSANMGTLERCYAIGTGGIAVAAIVRLAGNITSKEAARQKSGSIWEVLFETKMERDARLADAASYETWASVLQWSAIAILLATAALVATQALRRPSKQTIGS